MVASFHPTPSFGRLHALPAPLRVFGPLERVPPGAFCRCCTWEPDCRYEQLRCSAMLLPITARSATVVSTLSIQQAPLNIHIPTYPLIASSLPDPADAGEKTYEHLGTAFSVFHASMAYRPTYGTHEQAIACSVAHLPRAPDLVRRHT